MQIEIQPIDEELSPSIRERIATCVADVISRRYVDRLDSDGEAKLPDWLFGSAFDCADKVLAELDHAGLEVVRPVK